MGLTLIYDRGQTPLSEDEMDGMVIKTISTQAELNQAEQLNIQEAIEWTLGKKWRPKDVLNEDFVCDLHRRMYKNVWRWAGKFRKTDKTIGVFSYLIPLELKKLVDDANLWVVDGHMPNDEIAVRFKHRIVSIHCFSNGNGRHSRLMADVIVSKLFGAKVFDWGAGDLSFKTEVRTAYIDALKQADQQDLSALIQFARSRYD
jgi:Fic-DOC domain mobile mystery protein B